jgi:hypothetical protein
LGSKLCFKFNKHCLVLSAQEEEAKNEAAEMNSLMIPTSSLCSRVRILDLLLKANSNSSLQRQSRNKMPFRPIEPYVSDKVLTLYL